MLDTIIKATINKFDLPNYLLKKIKSIKYMLTKYQAYTQKKNKKIGEKQTKSNFQNDKLEKNTNSAKIC